MHLVIIDYGSGNLRSLEKALIHILPDSSYQVSISSKRDDILKADKLLLPGVGAFDACMHGLRSEAKLEEVLIEKILHQSTPILGICVGMQLLMESSEEAPGCQGLGFIKGQVKAIAKKTDLKIPHIGWNSLKITRPHPLLKDIRSDMHMYFVHSYHVVPKDQTIPIATVDYGQTIVAAFAQGHIMATQFHPEKSQLNGLSLLKQFLYL